MSDLDEELAAATDLLLSGREIIQLSEGNRELELTLRRLYFTIAPDRLPEKEFEQRLAARLSSEWNLVYGRSRLRLLDYPLMRVAAVAAAAVLILVAVLVMAVPGGAKPVVGTALSLNVVIAAAALVLFAVLVIVITHNHH